MNAGAALIIGYGNPLRQDDALGLRIAERVAEQRPDVEVLVVQQLTPELADPVARSRFVVFVDARSDDPQGGVASRELEPEGGAQALLHHGDPRSILALSQAVYGYRPRAFLVTAPASALGHGIGLSEQAERHVAPGADLISALVSDSGR